ncbi:hypothetical protein C8Q77DRAFT_223608 [Trametes polyzona]|nr:hypothetical protein C8Q77DRAFT_223608 [Trametes polyzona]
MNAGLAALAAYVCLEMINYVWSNISAYHAAPTVWLNMCIAMFVASTTVPPLPLNLIHTKGTLRRGTTSYADSGELNQGSRGDIHGWHQPFSETPSTLAWNHIPSRIASKVWATRCPKLL